MVVGVEYIWFEWFIILLFWGFPLFSLFDWEIGGGGGGGGAGGNGTCRLQLLLIFILAFAMHICCWFNEVVDDEDDDVEDILYKFGTL